MHDAIIVGGGPAGLAAALTLGRSHRRVLLLDAGQGRNAPASAVHNLLAHDGTPPEELRRIGRDQLTRYPGVELRQATVDGAHALADEGFRLQLGGGERVETRRLLLATGLADELPAIDGLAPLWGRSAFHCPYCHGFEVSGRRLAVLGAGPERVRLALQLTRFTNDLVLCTDGEPLDPKLAELLAANGVRVLRQPVARFEGDDGRLERIVLKSGEPLDRDAVFIATVLHQRSDLAGRLGCAMLPDGCVEVDEFAGTSVAGCMRPVTWPTGRPCPGRLPRSAGRRHPARWPAPCSTKSWSPPPSSSRRPIPGSAHRRRPPARTLRHQPPPTR